MQRCQGAGVPKVFLPAPLRFPLQDHPFLCTWEAFVHLEKLSKEVESRTAAPEGQELHLGG